MRSMICALLLGLSTPLLADINPAVLVASHRHVSPEGYSIVIPGGWEIKENWNGADFLASRPYQTQGERFPETVSVIILPATDMTLENFYALSIKDLKIAATGLQIVSEGASKLDGEAAKWLIYTHKIGTLELKVLQYVAVSHGRGYIVKLSATSDSFATARPNFDEIVNSFRFNPAK